MELIGSGLENDVGGGPACVPQFGIVVTGGDVDRLQRLDRRYVGGQQAGALLILDALDLQLVTQSERQLPHRTERIFTYDSQSIHPAGAPYRHTVTVDGDRVSRYEQRVRVPDQWQRDYHELRSKNLLVGQADTVLFIITMVAVVAIFIIRLLRGNVSLRLLLGVAIASVVLGTGTGLNSFPIALAGYDTTSTYPAFLVRVFLQAFLGNGVAAAMLLVVSVGAGEALYRERLPQHLAIPRLWRRKALASKRVFLSFVIGYAVFCRVIIRSGKPMCFFADGFIFSYAFDFCEGEGRR